MLETYPSTTTMAGDLNSCIGAEAAGRNGGQFNAAWTKAQYLYDAPRVTASLV
jgi:hypothetical protein